MRILLLLLNSFIIIEVPRNILDYFDVSNGFLARAAHCVNTVKFRAAKTYQH